MVNGLSELEANESHNFAMFAIYEEATGSCWKAHSKHFVFWQRRGHIECKQYPLTHTHLLESRTGETYVCESAPVLKVS